MSKLVELHRDEVVNELGDPESQLRASFMRLDEGLSQLYKDRGLTPTTELETLYGKLDASERELLQALNTLDPSDYGITTPPQEGIDPVPETLVVEFVSAVDKDDEGNFKKSYQHVPVHVHAAFEAMNAAFQAEHPERRLKIVSGYRSPAFQLYTFVRYLVHVNDFDLVKTFRRVMLPAFSQHCRARETALDIANIDGKPSDTDPEDFEDTIECRWLREHGHEFGFIESYPKDNPHGIMPESWHWQHQGNAT